jgi:RNA polymerase sigma-70 factor (ECF subfamily)
MSNEELLLRCRGGDEAALQELFRRHEKPIYSLLYRMLGRHEDAEEALADVFVKVWRSAASFRGDSKFTTWLYRIAGNTARDMLRSRKARPEVAVDDTILAEMELPGTPSVDPEATVVANDEVARIERAIGKLSPDDRLLVTLYHIQDMSLEEIARVTGKNRTSLKVKLFRARQRLKGHLDDMDRETDNEMHSGTTESFGLQQGSAESA